MKIPISYFIIAMALLLIGGTLAGIYYPPSFLFWLGAVICGVVALLMLILIGIGIRNQFFK